VLRTAPRHVLGQRPDTGSDLVFYVTGRGFEPGETCWIASISAHRTSGDPCLVIGPRLTLASDSRCRGVSPAHEHSRAGVANR
jgi:hypothetical protein